MIFIFVKSGARVRVLQVMGNFATVEKLDDGKLMWCPLSSLVDPHTVATP